MSRNKRRTEAHPDGTTAEGSDVFDEVIAAAQDRQQSAEPVTQDPAANGHTDGPAPETNGHAHEARTEQQKREWIRRFGHWRDNEAGVRIEEDRRNKLSTIYFREAPPIAALDLLLDRGWVKDEEMGGYSKPHSKLRPSESREQADETVHEVRNIVRAARGLPPKENFYVSRA